MNTWASIQGHVRAVGSGHVVGELRAGTLTADVSDFLLAIMQHEGRERVDRNTSLLSPT